MASINDHGHHSDDEACDGPKCRDKSNFRIGPNIYDFSKIQNYFAMNEKQSEWPSSSPASSVLVTNAMVQGMENITFDTSLSISSHIFFRSE